MNKKYRCLICDAIVEVELDIDDTFIKREFKDAYFINPDLMTKYLWGGQQGHICPLLQYSTKLDFDNLISRKEIEEIK